MKILYHPLAEKDIEKAAEHYQTILSSLAKDFLKEIEGGIEKIVKHPLRFRIVRDNLRKCNL